MTPDHTDNTAQDAAQNAILSDAASSDTTALGILRGGTAQVRVAIPESHDDDLVDDDVIGDEVPPGDRAAVGSAAAPEPGENGPRPAGVSAVSTATPAYDALRGGDVLAGVVAGPAHAHTDADAHAHGEDITDAVVVPDDEEAAVRPAPHVSAPRASAPLSLASKRLGQLSAATESADLLTADRLLESGRTRRVEPEGGWQRLMYSLTAGRVNLGDGKRARARKALQHRIGAGLNGGAKFVPVLSRKGGVGKTTVTTLLGMALADARDDRVIAVDANPDRGTLAERIAHAEGKTVRDLVRAKGTIDGYNDLTTVVARDQTRLDVLASDGDPRVAQAFSDSDYEEVAALAAHYYSIVLTDTGTGIVHSVMSATLAAADQLVIVAGLSVDEARLASETLTWLETNGHADKVRTAVVVLNNSRPGTPLVRQDELEVHFRSRARAVVRMPYDPVLGAGSTITFSELKPATRRAARELAAVVVEGLRASTVAA